MTFLSRPRSFHKDSTPHPTPTAPLPLQNIYRRTRTESGSSSSHGLISRVSMIFTPRRKSSNHKLKSSTTHSSSTFTYSESADSEEDEIRRPSGLGRSVSISSSRSIVPSPRTNGTEHRNSHTLFPSNYTRVRAVSSPNLPPSSSDDAQSRQLRVSNGSVLSQVPLPPLPPQFRQSIPAHILAKGPLPPLPPKFQQSIPAHILAKEYELMSPPAYVFEEIQELKQSRVPTLRLDFPLEVTTLILSHLTPHLIAIISPISRNFASAARTILYKGLELHKLSPRQLQRLISLLASRQDLAELVQKLSCHTWPFFFPSSPHYTKNAHTSQQNTVLKAAFTLAIQRMSSLTHIVLPSFDLPLLAHHTAFGLQSLTFLNASMNENEKSTLLTWLDGQINITSLHFPHLEDDDGIGTALLSPNSEYTQRLSAAYAYTQTSYTSSASTSPSPSLASSPVLSSPGISSSLLPNLTSLWGPPSFINLLGTKASSFATARRPLVDVKININRTLYSGLRPSTMFSHVQGIEHLCLRFGENVDRRTIEKVLSTAGAMVGDISKLPSEGIRLHSLCNLEVDFLVGGTVPPPTDQVIYKCMQSVLPRYKALKQLRLSYSRRGDAESLNRFYALDPKTNISRDEGARVNVMIKHCPTLRLIMLLSNSTWHHPS